MIQSVYKIDLVFKLIYFIVIHTKEVVANMCNYSYVQVSHSELKYKKMGLIGTLKIVSYLGDASNVSAGTPCQVESISFQM